MPYTDWSPLRPVVECRLTSKYLATTKMDTSASLSCIEHHPSLAGVFWSRNATGTDLQQFRPLSKYCLELIAIGCLGAVGQNGHVTFVVSITSTRTSQPSIKQSICRPTARYPWANRMSDMTANSRNAVCLFSRADRLSDIWTQT
jgi:hypothetical protein